MGSDVNSVVVKGTTGTTSASVDLTSPGFGTVKGAIVLCARATSFDTRNDHGGISIGFWDGTNQRVMHMSAEDDVTDGNYNRDSSASYGVIIQATGDNTDALGAISNDPTDGIRITWSAGDDGSANRAADYKLAAILFNGDDFTCEVGTITDTIPQTPSTWELALGWQPQFLWLIDIDAGSDSTWYGGMGIASDNGAGTDYGALGYYARYNETAQIMSYWDDACLTSEAWTATGPRIYATGWDSNGVDLSASASHTRDMYYLAISAGDTLQLWADSFTTPTTDGAWDFNTPGFEPQCLVLFQTACPGVGTRYGSSPNVDGFGIGISDGTTHWSMCMASDDGPATSDTATYCSETPAVYEDGVGTTTLADINGLTLDADGWSCTDAEVVDFDSTARYWWGLAIEVGSATTAGRSHILGGGVV
jgi:hypothetical protein